MTEFRYIGLAAMASRAIGAMTVAVNQSAEHLVAEAQAAAPVDEGTLQASITTDGAQVGGNSVEAKVYTGGESSGYAIFVHEGTGPHPITPANGKALAFDGIVVTKVMHPGTAATKFLERPLLANTPLYREAMRRAARAAF